MRFVAAGLCALVLGAWLNSSVGATTSCEVLASLMLPNAAITLAHEVPGGAPVLPLPAAGGVPSDGAARAFRVSRAFCRVAATLRPTSDSDIKMEVWLPSESWNGKLLAVGNGAFNGTIAYPAMVAALERGYATSSTDTGHVGGSARFALGHSEKLVDFGWRAVHEMTTAAKALVASHYGVGPTFVYFNGCSAGGRQAMQEAQRFPADFDGIVAGSPGIDWTGRAVQANRVARALQKNEAARLSPASAQLLHAAVLNACDALDGVKDGVIDDPKRCTFDPGVIQCRGAEDASCLSPAQVATARMLYAPQVNPKTKRETAGLERGSELSWTDMGWSTAARATGLDQFRFIVFQDPQWTLEQFNVDTDIVRADDLDVDNTINALNPNLKPFIARGGKLLQYHGWADPQIAPGNSVEYYDRVVRSAGGEANVRNAYRLFMVPGMAHCGGGDGPNNFDALGALEQWVEQGKAPERIIASHSTDGTVDRTRPLCPYPEVAAYRGTGSTSDAASFVCMRRGS